MHAALALRDHGASSSLGLLVTEVDSAPAARAEVEPDLVAALARGDAGALRELYTRHHAEVRAFARRLTGDEGAAEDLVHEVFVALPGAAKRFRGDASLRTLLLSIAANASFKVVRGAVRRRKAMSRFADEPAAPPSSPDARLERRRLAEALTRALDELPHDQRVAFVLCEVEERTSREVAEIVGAKEATIRTRLFHAKQKLRTLLERDGLR